MSFDGLVRELATRHIPNPQRAILCDAGDLFAIGRDGDGADDVCVAGERVAGLQAGLDVPYSNGVVPGGAGDAAVVGEEGDASDGVGVADEGSEGADVLWSAETASRGEHA